MFSPVQLFAAVLIAALATGCETYQAKPLAPEQTAIELEARSLDAPGLKSFLEKNRATEIKTWPLPSWNFENLTLAAFYFNPSLEVARAQWQVATAGEISAGARPNPTVGVAPEYAFNPDKGISPWIFGANIDWPIETAGKRGYRIAQSQKLSKSAKWNIAVAAMAVRNQLRTSLIDFAAAQVRTELLLRQKEVQAKISQALENEFKAGAISSFEATTARIALTKAEMEISAAEKQLAENRARLAEAVGVPVAALAKIRFDFDLRHVPENDLSEPDLRRVALRNRPDLLSALSDYAASESALQLEIAKQYPDVHLGTGYQFDQGENKWSLGLSLELPALNRNEGGIAEAKARRAEMAARFVALQAKVIAEIDRAVAIFTGAKNQIDVAQQLIAAQEKQHRALQNQLATGEIGRREILDADLELATARLQHLDALTQLQQAFGEVENAAQLPLDSMDLFKSPRAQTGDQP